MIAAVILAAGASRRLGRPKQTIVLAGETFIERAVRTARQAGLFTVIVIVRPEGDDGHALQKRGCLVVLNEQADEGIAASIRYGVKAAEALRAHGVVLMTCDQVALRPQHLRELCADPASIAGSGYAGRVGIPAYFPASSFAALLKLQGDTGARDLLQGVRSVFAEALELDVDTNEDVARAQELIDGDFIL